MGTDRAESEVTGTLEFGGVGKEILGKQGAKSRAEKRGLERF